MAHVNTEGIKYLAVKMENPKQLRGPMRTYHWPIHQGTFFWKSISEL